MQIIWQIIVGILFKIPALIFVRVWLWWTDPNRGKQ